LTHRPLAVQHVSASPTARHEDGESNLSPTRTQFWCCSGSGLEKVCAPLGSSALRRRKFADKAAMSPIITTLVTKKGPTGLITKVLEFASALPIPAPNLHRRHRFNRSQNYLVRLSTVISAGVTEPIVDIDRVFP